ncbi:DUF4037 domain-containing protein [Leifsonia sp. SIMBA_070]|uniref:DUF4037 domain-containing protein n=1 Tax=Leifsonia sp. SIMBA_070 TaxID=3085810 RepID=UPI00397A9B62
MKPLLADRFPGLQHAAGRLGGGSDVLGLDDAVSRDHDWGLRLNLMVPPDLVSPVETELESRLPLQFRGLPVRFAFTGESAAQHHIEVGTLTSFLVSRLGFDPRERLSAQDWLSLSGQSVLEVTAGPLFADDGGEVERARSALTWYPDDVWRYVLAADWIRLGQELPLMSRAGDAGDDRGSRIIAGRLSHVVMHLAFLLEQRWPPYAKWLGAMFGQLECAPTVGASIDQTLRADSWRDRQDSLAASLRVLLDMQNDLSLTETVSTATIPFWDRPYLHAEPAIASVLVAHIEDPAVRALPLGLGSIEQRTDLVDLLINPEERRRAVGAPG